MVKVYDLEISYSLRILFSRKNNEIQNYVRHVDGNNFSLERFATSIAQEKEHYTRLLPREEIRVDPLKKPNGKFSNHDFKVHPHFVEFLVQENKLN